MPRYVTMPDQAAGCDLGPVTVLVNYRTGDVHTLHGPPARWLAELAATGNADAPTVLDAADAATVLATLCRAGLLEPTPQPRPWPTAAGQPLAPSWGTDEVQAGRTPIPPVPYRLLPVAALALLVVLAVAHSGRVSSRMARLIRLLGWTTHATIGPATAENARQAVYAVRRVGLFVPGRVACLEESVAVVLMLAVSRQRVVWCHGVAGDPVRLHAWVETGGQPIAEPPSTRRYTPLRTI